MEFLNQICGEILTLIKSNTKFQLKKKNLVDGLENLFYSLN
jgi:hypothetical protein